MSFEKILVANRGEIACRVIQTAKDMGYQTVAVFSQADANARHVKMADQAVCIGSAQVADSYLNIEAILDAADRSRADAIHPGYGFLSENYAFAQACTQAAITFIGPAASAIELMGCKRKSKIAMQQAGVPCIPGYEGDDQSDDTLLKEAEKAGLPLMIKAAAGGGGRGMRIVNSLDELKEQLRSARSEASHAFGSDELILERALIGPRHIEIQVFGDQHGQVIHLGERDCSVQRRHQKVVEEAPSPVVSEALRQAMGAAAVQAAQSCRYTGAGTVEFLLDEQENFYFLEMNTRLQVEHPVTELVTGLDLVEWQIRIARGEQLPLKQDQVQLNGHAIEVRLYAEDSHQQFTPQTGPILDWQPAAGKGLRIDHGLRAGSLVSSHYDPMLAKLVSYGNSREDAIRQLVGAIRNTRLLGVTTNRAFLHNILRHPIFVQGKAHTGFVQQDFHNDPSLQQLAHPPEQVLLAAAMRLGLNGSESWQGWRSSGTALTPAVLDYGNDQVTVYYQLEQQRMELHVAGQIHSASLVDATPREITLQVNNVQQTIPCLQQGTRIYIDWEMEHWELEDKTQAAAESADQKASGLLRAPMDGTVLDVLCQPGDILTQGQPVLLLEAMKIEHSICADTSGTLESVEAKSGDQVRTRQVLARIEPECNE